MVIGILGILKAGGAYVPLDPSYPGDRLHFMLTDAQVSILLTQSWLVEKLPVPPAQILCLDQPLCPRPKFFFLERETANPLDHQGIPNGSKSINMGDCTVTSDRLAYVIYTSGSTGTPKGVLLTHRGLCTSWRHSGSCFSHPATVAFCNLAL